MTAPVDPKQAAADAKREAATLATFWLWLTGKNRDWQRAADKARKDGKR